MLYENCYYYFQVKIQKSKSILNQNFYFVKVIYRLLRSRGEWETLLRRRFLLCLDPEDSEDDELEESDEEWPRRFRPVFCFTGDLDRDFDRFDDRLCRSFLDDLMGEGEFDRFRRSFFDDLIGEGDFDRVRSVSLIGDGLLECCLRTGCCTGDFSSSSS